MQTRRDCAGAQRDGGEQLHRERSGSEGWRRGADDGSGTSGRRASVEFTGEAIWDCGEEGDAAAAGAEFSGGAESVRRCDYATDAGDFLQPYHDGDGSGAAGERIVRAGEVEGNSVGGGWRARAGD